LWQGIDGDFKMNEHELIERIALDPKVMG
jgi:hypothetical protein